MPKALYALFLKTLVNILLFPNKIITNIIPTTIYTANAPITNSIFYVYIKTIQSKNHQLFF